MSCKDRTMKGKQSRRIFGMLDEVAWYGEEDGCCRSSREKDQYGNTDSARDVVDFVGESVDVVR